MQIEATREHIRREVERIVPSDPLERTTRQDVLDWIDSGAQLTRQRKPDIPPKHLIAYFVVIDGSHLLLVDHINAQLWLPPGGHVEHDEHPQETVRREALEELSLTASFVVPGPTFISVCTTVGITAGHQDVCLWYLLRGDRHATVQFDRSEFESVKWVTFAQAAAMPSDPHLVRFLSKLKTLTANRP